MLGDACVWARGGGNEQSDIGHVRFEVAGYKFGDHMVN